MKERLIVTVTLMIIFLVPFGVIGGWFFWEIVEQNQQAILKDSEERLRLLERSVAAEIDDAISYTSLIASNDLTKNFYFSSDVEKYELYQLPLLSFFNSILKERQRFLQISLVGTFDEQPDQLGEVAVYLNANFRKKVEVTEYFQRETEEISYRIVGEHLLVGRRTSYIDPAVQDRTSDLPKYYGHVVVVLDLSWLKTERAQNQRINFWDMNGNSLFGPDSLEESSLKSASETWIENHQGKFLYSLPIRHILYATADLPNNLAPLLPSLTKFYLMFALVVLGVLGAVYWLLNRVLWVPLEESKKIIDSLHDQPTHNLKDLKNGLTQLIRRVNQFETDREQLDELKHMASQAKILTEGLPDKDSVYYVETIPKTHKSLIHSSGNDAETTISLNNLLKYYPGFIRVGRQTLVNGGYVKRVYADSENRLRYYVEMSDGKSFPIGNAFQESAIDALKVMDQVTFE